MSYCDKTIGSILKLNGFAEEYVLTAVQPGIVARLPELTARGAFNKRTYGHVEPEWITKATTLAELCTGFHLELLRDDAKEMAALKSTFEPWTNTEPLLRPIAQYLVRGSWHAVTDDYDDIGIYIVDPAAPDSLRVVEISYDDYVLLSTSIDENGRDHSKWGSMFNQDTPYDVKITTVVKAMTKCDWLLPCFAGYNWEQLTR